MLAYQFPPDTGSVQRVRKFVQYLPEFGWKPVVVTRRLDFSRSADYTFVQDVSGAAQVVRVGFPDWFARFRAKVVAPSAPVESVTTLQTRIYPLPRSGFLRVVRNWYRTLRAWVVWPDSAVSWLPSAALASLRLISTKGIQVVYTVSPPHSVHLIGVFLKRLRGVRWAADFRDPWANDPDIPMPTLLHQKAHQWAERLVLKTADRVIATTDFHTEYLRGRLPAGDAARVKTITNGYDPEDMTDPPSLSGSRFRITYTGGFYASRSATPFLKALVRLRTHHPNLADQISIQIIGSSHELVVAEVKALNLQDVVQFPGYLEHRRAIREMAQSTVLLLVVHSDPLVARTSIPAKLFEYMATGRPILAISPPGAAAELVRMTGCGIVVDPSDVDGIEKAIVDFYRQYVRGEIVASHCAPEIFQRFHRRTLTQSLATLLDEIAY